MSTVYTDKEQAEYDVGYLDGLEGNEYSSLVSRTNGISCPYGKGYFDGLMQLSENLKKLAKYHNNEDLKKAAEFLYWTAAKI